MNNNEKDIFIAMLPEYLAHFIENPHSLMARIYGLFTVQMQDVVPVHILLMSNAAKCGKFVYKTFDLKGSIVNREVKANEMLTTSCLKDVNLLNLCKDEFILGF